jgi:uncharacterized protein HemX
MGGAVIGQPVAIVLIVLILGACIYMWTQGQMRSRAGLLTIAGILAVLVYLAFWASPTVG